MYQKAFDWIKGTGVRPEGWLRRQLEIEAQGLVGHLDQVWPDIRDSQWIGGDREGWERVPYWLDGLIPLAWQLNDADLKARAQRYIDHILAAQEPDGWLCPCAREKRKEYDVWALFLILKVLTVYADFSDDSRIEEAVEKALRCLDRHIDATGIFRWAQARWFECLISIYWLYARKPENWLIELAKKLRALGADWDRLVAEQPIDAPQSHWNFWRHVVNLAMAIKQNALTYPLTGADAGAGAQMFLDTVMRGNGMVIGHFSGDECLTGMSCNSGTELCGLAEAMYSYEWLLATTGETRWGDDLEYLAFNGFAATASADMWTHQYLQMPNQVRCAPFAPGETPFRTNGAESHIFGLEPNFGCCTANMAQAWPKLAMSAFLRTADALVSAVLVPATAELELGGAHVRCTLSTDYPFHGALRYTVETDRPVEFSLKIRVPGFAAAAKIDQCAVETGAFHTIRRIWRGSETVEMSLSFAPEWIERPYGLWALRAGPLLYCLPLREEWKAVEYTRNGVERRFPYCDYEVTTEDAFGYGFAAPIEQAQMGHGPVGNFPFGAAQPAAWITMPLAPVEWRLTAGKCQPMPVSGAPVGEARAMRLVPYGCARLRMTELPRCL